MSGLEGVGIVFINNFAKEYLGGGEVHLLHLIRAALEAHMRVALVAPRRSAIAERATGLGVSVREISFEPWRGPLLTRQIATVVEANGASLVHGTGYFTNLIARRVARATNALAINTVHVQSDAPAYAQRLGRFGLPIRRLLDWATSCDASAIVADSASIARSLRLRSRVPVVVVHNAVGAEEVRHEARSSAVPALVIGARGENSAILGTIGRLEMVKGIPTLLDAMLVLLDGHYGVHLFIAGSGPMEGKIRTRLAADSRLRGSVTLLGHVESAPAFLNALDLFVLPSLSEGFNTAVLEAMALGVPVVATAAGGNPEAILDGQTGLLVPAGDPKALADAIQSLLLEPDRARAMGALASSRVGERFDVARMTELYLHLYADLLAEGVAGSRAAGDALGAGM